MPIYEYRCKECGNVFECFVRHNHKNQIVCPECGSSDIEKILSVTHPVCSGKGQAPGKTCCGRDERCDSPPCGRGRGGGRCQKDRTSF